MEKRHPFFLSVRDFILLDQAEFLHDVAGNIDSTSRKPTYRLHEFSQIRFHTVASCIFIRNEKRISEFVIACCRLFFSNQNTRPVCEILGEIVASSCGFTSYHLHPSSIVLLFFWCIIIVSKHYRTGMTGLDTTQDHSSYNLPHISRNGLELIPYP